MDDGKIVIVNLTPGKRQVPFQVADTMGSVIINEVFNQALTKYQEAGGKPNDTFLVLDEFHRFLGPDIYDFLPMFRILTAISFAVFVIAPPTTEIRVLVVFKK